MQVTRVGLLYIFFFFFFQAEDGIRDAQESRGLGDVYKRQVWEISMKKLINMAADRGAFIDQSQSFNVFMGQPNMAKLTSMHFYGWKKGLKTGQYYLRGRAAASAVKFTVDPATAVKAKAQAPVSQVPPEPEECLNCGS
eukprot:TRINITY_DN12664_c0_g1_i6.p1 TRINITY_DN12664_c0_g1~~TRINITY_DN12664_c0_g1_i6.p1  ORF type:complete len:139 (+),score=57.85 TRINITY_DN12664_c0_g1_i6:55-471(+)